MNTSSSPATPGWVWAIVGLAAAWVVLMLAGASGFMTGWGHDGSAWERGFFPFMPLMMLMPLLFLALIVVAIVLVVNAVAGQGHKSVQPPGNETPLEILERRYARGELGREEYLRMREDLMEGRGP